MPARYSGLRQAVVLLALALLAGCVKVTLLGHTVTEGRDVARDERPALQVREVSLAFTPPARQQMRGDSRFDASAMQLAVVSAFERRQLLDPEAARSTAEILVDEIAVSAGSSTAAAPAALSAEATLGGMVRVLGPDGVELRSHPLRIETTISIERNAAEGQALQALYRVFATRAAEMLAPPSQPR